MQETGEENIRFATLGVYPILLPPLFLFLFLTSISIYIKHDAGMIMFGMFSVLLLIGSVAEIRVVDDGIVVRRLIFGTSYWSFDEVKSKMGGRILAYGGMYGGWIMPLSWKDCIQAIKLSKVEVPSIRRSQSKTHLYIYLLLPPFMLLMIESILRYFEVTIPLMLNAPLWGLTTTFSFALFAYKAPIRFKIDSLGRLGSSLILGLPIGLTIMLLIMLPTL